MTPEREKEIEDLINKRSQSHVRELWDVYQELKKENADLKAEIELTDGEYARGLAEGAENMKLAFVGFLKKAGEVTVARASLMAGMEPEDLMKKLKGE